MNDPIPMSQVWRGGFLEATHLGHAVICDAKGAIVESWGNPDLVFLPRSAVKMIQALPLVESGAADAFGLSESQVSFACASHMSFDYHVSAANDWLGSLGLNDGDLACGPQEPRNRKVRDDLIKDGKPVCRVHNNCSGKHCGMLTTAKHIGGGLDYVDPDHPVQVAIKEAFSDLTGEDVSEFGIDGCSAPNYAVRLSGLAKAMAFFADATETGDVRNRAAFRIRNAMAAHPQMVSGDGEPCTELMRALEGRVTLKGGAEGSYTAIIPELGFGVALKIADGTKRAQDAAMAAILVHLGLLDAAHPAARRWRDPIQKNFARLETGQLCPAPGFPT